MAGCIQQDGLGSGINAAGCCYAGIEGYGDIHVELALYLLRCIFLIVQDDDSKGDLVPIFPCKRFEIGDIKAGTGTIRVKEMQENRLITGNGQFALQVD